MASGFERSTKHTRRQVFLQEILAAVPGDAFGARIALSTPAGTTEPPPYPVLLLLRVHFLERNRSRGHGGARVPGKFPSTSE